MEHEKKISCVANSRIFAFTRYNTISAEKSAYFQSKNAHVIHTNMCSILIRAQKAHLARFRICENLFSSIKTNLALKILQYTENTLTVFTKLESY